MRPGESAPRPASFPDLFPSLSRSELIWLPIVLAALLAIYLPGLGNGLVFDDTLLTDDRLLVEYGSLLEFRSRMISYGSFAWVQALFGEGWWKQRLVNLAIHIGVVLALWALYREILRCIAHPPVEAGRSDEPIVSYDRSPALGLAVGCFALNPVAVYAVAYLIQRSILLATLFVVLGLWLFALGLARRKPAFHVLAFVCYGLAVLSKEHAVFAPLAAVPLYILVMRPGAKRLAALAGASALATIGAALALSLKYGHIIGVPFDEYSHVYLAQLARLSPDAPKNAFALSIVNQAYLFFEYGLRWFIPSSDWMSINLRPPFPVKWLTFPQVLGLAGYAATVIGGFWLLVRYRDGRALLGLSILFPALLFATEFATVWIQDPFVLYRSYLWAIGVPGIVFFVFHGPSPRVLLGIGLGVGALLVWQATDRVLSMATPERVWTDAIAKLPDDPRSVGRWFPYLNRGSAYVERDQFPLAMKDFETSAALGDMGMGAVNLGALLSASGDHRRALAAFDLAERQGYKLYNLPFQRGLALLALGRPAEAYRQFEITVAGNPQSPTRELALLHLARTGLPLGKQEEAIKSLEQLITIDPRHKEGRYLLGMAYYTKGDYARALDLLDRLLLDDARGPVYYAHAMANFGLKRKAEALADIENAIRLGPDHPAMHQWRARIQAMP